MRKVNLTMKGQTKYEIVKRFVDNKCTNYKNLALQLNSFLKLLIISFLDINLMVKNLLVIKIIIENHPLLILINFIIILFLFMKK